MSDPLLQPVRLGDLRLRNPIVMAPCTRCFSPGYLPTADVAAYYGRRAAGGVGLIITEGTVICERANGYPDVPGIFEAGQVEAWRRVTARVHDADGRIACQLWHTGTYAHPRLNGGRTPEGPSGIPPEGFHSRLREPDGSRVPYEPGEAMTEARIVEVIELFRRAAGLAMEAGFDAVEIHGAHTYLIDQFLNLHWNRRADAWGGAGRARFAGEVARAVVEEVGAGRVLFRFSPHWAEGMRRWKKPAETLPLLLETLHEAGIRVLHASTPSFDRPLVPAESVPVDRRAEAGATGDGLLSVPRATRLLWPHQVLGVGELGVDRARAAVAAGEVDAVAFGRALIANPDLVDRIRRGMPLRAYDPALLQELY
jgi:2,4-dienoyl-CoA reductase-like NADH-dependent reductase (Old Yellow Enzyme family)